MSNEENEIKTPEESASVVAEDVKDAAPEQQAPASEQAAQDVAEETPVEAEEEKTEPTSESVAPAPEKQAKEKPQKVKTQKSSDAKRVGGMSKLFKLVYFPVLALFVALMLVFSIIDGAYGYKPNAYDDKYYEAVNTEISELCKLPRSSMAAGGITSASTHLTTELSKGGFVLVDEDKPESETDPIVTTTDWARNGNLPVPTVTLHTAVPSGEVQTRIGKDYVVGLKITNVVAAVPSKATRAGESSDAVIITVRYDVRPDSAGAAENASFVANAVQTLKKYADNATLQNDLIVVFTEDMDGAYGSYTFFDSFEGLGDVVSRAKYGINLDAYGNGGTLAITDATGAGLDYIAACSSVGNAFKSSVVTDAIPEEYKNSSAVGAFGSVPALQVAVVGGLDYSQSLLDTPDKLSQSIIHQQADFLKDYIDTFANSDKTYSGADDSKPVFFSYLGGSTAVYGTVGAYVVGAVILALIIATVIVLILKKAFSVQKLVKALFAEVLVIVFALIAMVAAYFLVTLMLSGFGVLPIHAIVQVRALNAGILIAAMIIAVAATFGFSIVFKKLFKVTSSDMARGTAMLFGVGGAVMSFACPTYSFLTAWLGMMLVAVLLISACCKNVFKAKFGFGMDRLFLYAIPVAFCLPMFMPTITMLTGMLPLAMLPLLMIPFAAALGVAVPYLDRTQVALDKFAKKLPMRTIRVQRIVTERVEDRAKKGKFTERTVKRVQKEKIAVNYKNYFGISVVAVLAIVIALFSGGFGVNYGKSITTPFAYDKAIYNDSIVYECTYTGDESATQKLIIADLMAYKYMRNAVDDLEWDGENGYYFKTVNYDKHIMPASPKISRSGNMYTVTTYDGPRSVVTLTIPSARNITKITVKKDGADDGMEYEFLNVDSITLRLPYGYGNSFILEFEGSMPSKIEYEEQSPATAYSTDNAIDALEEWNSILLVYKDEFIGQNLRGGIVLKRTFNSL